MWCSICGVSGSKERLFDVVDSKEIIRVCENCARNEHMPIVRKPTVYQLQAAERRPTLDERLARMRGVPAERAAERLGKTNMSLRETINKNYEKSIGNQRKPRPDLVHNFHWTILRVRRARRVTQEQMARDINEPESAIRMAERGILPADNRLIKKIEDYLGVQLLKEGIQQSPRIPTRTIEINPQNAKNLKVADLQRKEAEMFWEGEDELAEDLEEGDER